MRASVYSIFFFALLFCCAFATPLFAQDTITNFMSPVVSYQYQDALGASTNAPVMSPVASYQYFDSVSGTDVTYRQSANVSYFFNVSDNGQSFTVSGRVADASGTPVSGASVTAALLQSPQASTLTAPDGTYQLPMLPQGVYVLKAATAGYASDTRAVHLNPGTTRQDFQIKLFKTPPTVTVATGTAAQPPTPQPTDSEGSMLMVFDGTQFVAITNNLTQLDATKMTVVLTHGWNSSATNDWPTNMAVTVQNKGALAQANIVAWNWPQAAAFPAVPPEYKTPRQGLALGLALYAVLGPAYQQPLDFQGHSLGALVNRYAVNYLHGQANAGQEAAAPPWNPARTHVTVFDGAEMSRFYSLDNVAVVQDLILYEQGTEAFAWKTPIPMSAAWVDNYISDVGLPHAGAVNVVLQKARAPLSPVAAHSYPQQWYADSATRVTTSSLLGYRQSFNYSRVVTGGGNGDFPPSAPNLRPGVIYHQRPNSSDPLDLEFLPLTDALESVFPVVGETANFVVHTPEYVLDGAAAVGRKIGDVTLAVAERVVSGVASGVNTVVNAAESGVANAAHQMQDLFSSAEMRLNLVTGLPPGPLGPQSRRSTSSTTASNTPAYLWLPIAVPADARLMAFDFMLTGNGQGDTLAFGVNGTNIFTLETKFIPTNQVSSSSLLDMSAYAGATNEFFFGVTGGSSTNCTVQVQNIRFYTLAPPQIAIAKDSGTTSVSWPSTLTGFTLEASASLKPPAWQPVTNSPSLYGGMLTVTNLPSDTARYFRLRKL